MKRIAFFAFLFLVGCSVKVQPHGHWGDRSDWRSNDWKQDYFADEDNHMVGWIEGGEHSVTAWCGSIEGGTLSGKFISSYETQEDAQYAIEKNCPVVEKKDD